MKSTPLSSLLQSDTSVAAHPHISWGPFADPSVPGIPLLVARVVQGVEPSLVGAWHTVGVAHMTNKRCLDLVDFAVADLENKYIMIWFIDCNVIACHTMGYAHTCKTNVAN